MPKVTVLIDGNVALEAETEVYSEHLGYKADKVTCFYGAVDDNSLHVADSALRVFVANRNGDAENKTITVWRRLRP